MNITYFMWIFYIFLIQNYIFKYYRRGSIFIFFLGSTKCQKGHCLKLLKQYVIFDQILERKKNWDMLINHLIYIGIYIRSHMEYTTYILFIKNQKWLSVVIKDLSSYTRDFGWISPTLCYKKITNIFGR